MNSYGTIIVPRGSSINMADPKRAIDLRGNIVIEYNMRTKTDEEEKQGL